MTSKVKENSMKILALDCETRPILAWTWSTRNVDIAPVQIEEPGGMICYAAKFVGEKKMYFDSVYHSSQEHMLESLRKLIDESDAVLHFNGIRFDMKVIQGEFLLRGMTPPKPCPNIDLYKVCKKMFRFPSNKMSVIAKSLGLPEKIEHEGFSLWRKVINNNPVAWKKMRAYNERDVEILLMLYEKLLPWINHPNRALYSDIDRPICPNCGSEKLQRRGVARTQTQTYARFQCNQCGKWSRNTKVEQKSKVKMVGL